ncbi:MAG: aminotransferase class IV [Bryobacterales bacterium]
MPTLPDPRNADIQIWVNGLKPRAEAKVSVFDSSVQGGDAVWEGLRIYDGKIADLDRHLDRMFDSAKAMAFVNVPSRDEIKSAIFATLEANGMRDGAHIRLTLTRGEKVTSGMSPHFNQSGCTLIVLAEWKAPVYDANGVRLITSAIRRNNPQCVDSKIHHNNLINNILAKIEANVAGVDDALMLDLNGFVSETNATNVFVIKRGVVYTPHADSCLPGITRGTVITLCRENGIELVEKNVSLTEVYTADEMFTTGTMGELSPVLMVDGRTIGAGARGPVTERLQGLHASWVREHGEPLPF